VIESKEWHDGYDVPCAMWSVRFHYSSKFTVPEGTVVSGCRFYEAPMSFVVEHVRQFKQADEIEEYKKNVSSEIQKAKDNVVHALDFCGDTDQWFKVTKQELPETAVRLSTEKNTFQKSFLSSYSSPEPPEIFRPELPTKDLSVKISRFNSNEGLRAMIDHFVAAKIYRRELPKTSLLMAYMVLEIGAWFEARAKAPKRKKDGDIITTGPEVQKLWKDLGIDARLPGLIKEKHIAKHKRLGNFKSGNSPLLHAIMMSRHKRMVGHGVGRDPLPKVCLPVDAAISAAREFILAYGDKLERERRLT
jgi:hypothetical protein